MSDNARMHKRAAYDVPNISPVMGRAMTLARNLGGGGEVAMRLEVGRTQQGPGSRC